MLYSTNEQYRLKKQDSAKEAYKENPEPKKKSAGDNNIKYSYFLSQELWRKIYDFQGGKCSVCDKILRNRFTGENPDGKTPATDHDHQTGKVRGIICAMPCNFLLGEVYDLETVKRLVIYMEDAPATKALGRDWYCLPGKLGTKIWQKRRHQFKDLPRLTELGLEPAREAYQIATGKVWKPNAKEET